MEKYKIEETEYQISKMPLGRFADLLSAVDELPKGIIDMDTLSKESFIAKIPQIAGQAMPKLIKALSIATTIPEEVLTEKVGLADGIKLVGIVWDVNDVEQIKNALGALVVKWRKPAPKVIETGSSQ